MTTPATRYIILCRQVTDHVATPYQPILHGHDVRIYETREACQAVCDELNTQSH